MLAPRIRGAFGPVAVGFLIAVGACTNGTEPTRPINGCDSASPLSLTPGEVQTPLSGTCVYVSGGTSGGEFALIPFDSDTSSSGTPATLSLSSSDVSAVTTPLKTLIPASSPMYTAVPDLSGNANTLQLPPYELSLRESERRVLTPLMSSARSWYRSRFTSSGPSTTLRPSYSTIGATAAVGDTVALNTKSGATLADACQTPDIRTGVIMAISQHAIVVADTGNPTGGYTQSDYQSIGIQFDSVYTMDVNAFGAPTDIDNNGHVIMFFTRAVNELTPRASSSVVGGFFYARDLFPTTDSPQLGSGSGCPTSNVAEMFYLMVPDPNGVVNGNVRTKTFVSHLTVSTTAHEFQHLINASRRLYINTTATDFEVVWLNEGLSHIAEELLFYQQSDGLAPRMDIDSLRFVTDQKNVDAYNFDQQSNFGRFRTYLQKPSTSSPYANDDSLWTRGATWSFLRYAADHRGTSDGDTFFKLVNSTTTGMANLSNVFGSGLPTMFRDWAIANLTDDVPGVSSEFQHPSWNFRSVFDFIPSIRVYPLATSTVSDASPLSLTLKGGNTGYVRFVIGAGQTGSVKWGTLPPNVTMTLVRLN
jgi:hypothetical protein